MTAQLHINSLFQARVDNSLWIQSQLDVANLANGLLLGRFLTELYQNSDDAGATDIDFVLNGKELTITHNGRCFNKDDVDKIVAFANQTIRSKSQDSNMTGHKGIGFKGLLSRVHKVWIKSGEYSFCFDESRWDKPMPWEMIPIWVDCPELPVNHVTFVFQLRVSSIIQQELQEFGSDPRSMLFLRHVKRIAIKENQSAPIVVNRQDAVLIRTLNASNGVGFRWIVKTTPQIPIPDPVHDSVKDLNSIICPDRLKRKNPVTLTFAYPLSIPNQPKPVATPSFEVANLLPTKVRLGLPFVVNGEFLLEPQREQFCDCLWNNFLCENVAFYQFLFLREFAQSERWKAVLRILGPDTLATNLEKDLRIAYERGFKAGYEAHAFIPAFSDHHTLLKLHACTVDSTGFYQKFRDSLPPTCIAPTLIHPELSAIDKLQKILHKLAPRNILDIHYVINQLEIIFKAKRDPKLCYEILLFLSEHFNYVYSIYKEKSWIPSAQGSLGKLSELSLPPRKEIPFPPSFVRVDVIDSAVMAMDQNNQLRTWLIAKGIDELSAHTMIKQYICKFIQEDKVSVQNSIELTRYLFRLYSEGYIDEKELKLLKGMPILSLNGSRSSVDELYIPKHYDPDQNPDLQALLPNQLSQFIHTCYSQENDSIPTWLSFFRALGAQEKLGLVVLEETTVGQLRQQNVDYLDDFLRHLYMDQPVIIGRRWNDSDLYRNVVFFPLMSKLIQTEFALLFWKTIDEWGKRLIKIDKACHFLDGRREQRMLAGREKLSYLKYVLNQYLLVYGTDGRWHRAKELYSPAFRSIAKDGFAVVNVGIELSEELCEHLGFQTQISAANCFNLLEKLRLEKINNLGLYITIIKNLIAQWKVLDKNVKIELIKKQWFFLAHNNTWQPVSALKCFAVQGATPSLQSSHWFKNVVLEMDELAALFNRPVIKQVIDEQLIRDAQEDEEFRKLILSRLPYIAWVRAHHLMEVPLAVIESLATSLKDLHVLSATSIPPLEDGSAPLDIVRFENRIFYTPKCTKYLLFEKVAEYFNFDTAGTKNFIEILLLKNDEERSVRSKKTVQEWVVETKIPLQDLQQMQAFLDSFDATRNPLAPPKAASALPTYSPHVATPSRQEDGDADEPVEDLAAIKLKTSTAERPDHHRDREEDVDALSGIISTLKLTPHPPEQVGAHSPDARRRLFVNEKTEWNPTVPIKDISLPDQFKIQKSNIQKEVKAESSSSSTARGPSFQSGPVGDTLSDNAKSEIGRWGEAFALKALVYHYESKYQVKATEVSSAHYQLVAETVTCQIKWINYERETRQPFDIEIIKQKGAITTFCPVEIKATKDSKIRFFLSENEMNLAKNNPKHRLYMIINAGQKGARIKKMPRNWLSKASISVNKYEVNATET